MKYKYINVENLVHRLKKRAILRVQLTVMTVLIGLILLIGVHALQLFTPGARLLLLVGLCVLSWVSLYRSYVALCQVSLVSGVFFKEVKPVQHGDSLMLSYGCCTFVVRREGEISRGNICVVDMRKMTYGEK